MPHRVVVVGSAALVREARSLAAICWMVCSYWTGRYTSFVTVFLTTVGWSALQVI